MSTFASVLVATAAAFVASFVWYAAQGRRLAALSPAYAADARPAGAVVPLELLRTLAVVVAVSVLVTRIGIDSAAGGAALGVLLWVGFPLVILSGSVLHEKVPWRLAAIHVADWLAKLVIVATIVAAWR
ncbi:DUF1761 domain-containing protein [Intrasporangium mesophilum]